MKMSIKTIMLTICMVAVLVVPACAPTNDGAMQNEMRQYKSELSEHNKKIDVMNSYIESLERKLESQEKKHTDHINNLYAQYVALNIESRSDIIEKIICPSVRITIGQTLGSGVVIHSEEYDGKDEEEIIEEPEDIPEIPDENPNPNPTSEDDYEWEGMEDSDTFFKFWQKKNTEDEETDKDIVRYKSYIISASHVVDSAPMGFPIVVEVFNYESEVYESATAKVIIKESILDYAILSVVTTAKLKTAKISTKKLLSNIELYSEVYNVGCPLGFNPVLTSGFLFSKGTKKLNGLWGSTAQAIHGNSGGGAFTHDSMEYIGIVVQVAGFRNGPFNVIFVPHLSYFRPVSDVIDHINKEKSDLNFLFE